MGEGAAMDIKTIPDSFIDETWAAMAACPQHTFLILTKRPQRMLEAVSRLIPKYAILPNVWIGCTVVNQAEADEKIPVFLQAPGKKFLSIEPILESIFLPNICGLDFRRMPGHFKFAPYGGIDAIILGSETGPSARPMQPDWAISIVRQCRSAGVPVFVKQIHINGKVSKDMNEWPEELRVRELPWLSHDSPITE